MQVALGLGANLGERDITLRRAAELLGRTLGPVRARSHEYETDPVVLPGDDPTLMPRFLNAVIVIETSCAPQEVLAAIRDVERELGRRRDLETKRWQPRVIDIDLLAAESEIVDEPGLIVPHPEMTRRAFVLEPFAEVWPEWRHPKSNKTAGELLADLQASGGAGQSFAQVL